jgi:hypothetical protein
VKKPEAFVKPRRTEQVEPVSGDRSMKQHQNPRRQGPDENVGEAHGIGKVVERSDRSRRMRTARWTSVTLLANVLLDEIDKILEAWSSLRARRRLQRLCAFG